MKNNFFSELAVTQLTERNFDEAISAQNDELICVFFWGHNCPNCDIAKNILLEEKERAKSWPIRWFHVNAYEESDLATRYGLHGIPVFMFFQNGKKLGRVTSFPGIEEFEKIIQKLKQSLP